MTSTQLLRGEYASGKQVNKDPVVYIFEDFITQSEIQALISTAESNLRRAKVSAETAGVVSKGRTGRNCWVQHQAAPGLAARISALLGLSLEYAENYQVIHYKETQKYNPHFDAWDADTDRGQRCMAKRGQRIVTCLLYLNTVEQGGGTCFPNLKLQVEAKKGRMVVFHNCKKGSNVRHPDSLHGGMSVEKGEKWACNLWFREKEKSGDA